MNKSKDDSFNLIWLYWVKKYMNDKMRPKDSISDIIAQLKKHYTLDTLDSRTDLQQKMKHIRENKGKEQWPIYIIDPERQLKLIEQNLNEQYEEYRNEIYSYYLNIKTIFIIYCNDWEGSQNLSEKGGSLEDNNNDNISEGNLRYKSQIKQLDNRTEGNKSLPKAESSSVINRIFHSCLQYQSNSCLNDDESVGETVQHNIDQLEIIKKMAVFDGLQIWSSRYKHIPHSYLKISNQAWKDCLNFPLMHPAQPRLINNLSLMPRLEPFQPGIDKLLPFVSYLKLLDKYFPGFLPTKKSIFQMNDLPVVFSKYNEGNWNEEQNVGLLCYYVVMGDDQNLNAARIQKWAQMNSQILLGKTIKQMNKRFKQRRKTIRQQQSKSFYLFQMDADGKNIW